MYGNIQTEQVIFRNMYVYTYTYMHVTIKGKKKETRDLKGLSKEGYMGRFGGRKRSEK